MIPGEGENQVTKGRHIGVDVDRETQERRILQCLKQHMNWDQIAQHLGYAHRSTAWKIWKKRMARERERMRETVDDMRDMQHMNLEAILKSLRPRCVGQKPSLSHINTYLKVAQSIRDLRGLDAPKEVRSAVNVTGTVEATPERNAQLIRQAFGKHGDEDEEVAIKRIMARAVAQEIVIDAPAITEGDKAKE